MTTTTTTRKHGKDEAKLMMMMRNKEKTFQRISQIKPTEQQQKNINRDLFSFLGRRFKEWEKI